MARTFANHVQLLCPNHLPICFLSFFTRLWENNQGCKHRTPLHRRPLFAKTSADIFVGLCRVQGKHRKESTEEIPRGPKDSPRRMGFCPATGGVLSHMGQERLRGDLILRRGRGHRPGPGPALWLCLSRVWGGVGGGVWGGGGGGGHHLTKPRPSATISRLCLESQNSGLEFPGIRYVCGRPFTWQTAWQKVFPPIHSGSECNWRGSEDYSCGWILV